MKSLCIFILSLFLSYTSKAQTATFVTDSSVEEIEPLKFDTILKGGYKIVFKVDDSLQHLYLKREETIMELSTCSRGLPYKNLGYVAADFDDYFVLAHSFGSGNPHYIELIKKSTGENVISNGAAWIDAIEDKDILLYSEVDTPSKKNSMILRNIKSGKEERYLFPNKLFDGPQQLSRIEIKSIDSKRLIIIYNTYEDPNNEIIKVYSRKFITTGTHS